MWSRVVLGFASVAGFAGRAGYCWWCFDPALEAWVLVLFVLVRRPHIKWGGLLGFAVLCSPETAGAVCRQVRSYVSIITAWVVGACGSGLREVSMHTSVMVRVGRMGVRARGLDRACVREGGLGLSLGVAQP
jgi:hypothetical protein